MSFTKKILKISGLVMVGLAVLLLVVGLAGRVSPTARAQGQYWYAKYVTDSITNAVLKEQARAAADTVGGKTPEETLRMFIDAVEKKDYKMASKYFVIAKQEKWINELINTDHAGGIESLLSTIKESLKNKGEFSYDGQSYAIYKPVLIDFIKYPKGNWKIVEI